MKYEVNQLLNLRPQINMNVFETFFRDNFDVDGIILALPMEEKDGKMFGTKNNLSKEQLKQFYENDFVKTDKGVYRNTIKNPTHFELRLRHTDNIVCIDIDGILENGDCCLTDIWCLPNMKDLFLDCPYTLSRNKQLPHFYFKLDGINIKELSNTYIDCFKDFKGDILFNHSWEKIKNNQMYNYKDELPVYDYQNIQHIFKDNIFKKKEKHIQKENKIYSGSQVNDLLNIIDVTYLKNYADWTKIVWSAKNCNVEADFIDMISQKADNYEASGFINVWSSTYPAYTIGTIKYYAKLSNSEEYYKILHKNIPTDIMDIKKLIHLKSNITIVEPDQKKLEEIEKYSVKEQVKAKKEIQANKDKLLWEQFNENMSLKTEYFEEYHAKILQPTGFVRICNRQIQLTTTKDLTIQYENVMVLKPTNAGPQPKKFTDEWRILENIRTYNTLDFLPPPLVCPKTTLNTFTGLEGSLLPKSEVDISIFTNQLLLLVGEDLPSYNYCLDYLSQMVQQPGIIPRTALVFKSQQGVGKNMFFEGIGKKLLGSTLFLATDSMEKVIGRFNMNQNKIMVIMDEVKGKDAFENSEALKNLITAETLLWEQKGLNPVKINNCGRYIFFSNGNSPVKIEYSDRRFNIYECSPKHKNDPVYFKALKEFLDDDVCMGSVYNMLMNRDISKWDSINDRVLTKAYKDIQSVNKPAMAIFLEQKIMDYEYSQTIQGEDDLSKVKSSDLFTSFKVWLSTNGFNKLEYNITKFGRELLTYEGITKTKVSTMVIHFDFKVLKEGLISKGYMEL